MQRLHSTKRLNFLERLGEHADGKKTEKIAKPLLSEYPEEALVVPEKEDDWDAAEHEVHIGRGVDEKKKEFAFNNRRMMLTYRTHLNKEEVITFFKTTDGLRDYDIEFIRIAHETADRCDPYEHSHVLIDWGKPFRKRGKGISRIFDIQKEDGTIIHPHIRMIGYGANWRQHWKRCMKYIAKEDRENLDLIDSANEVNVPRRQLPFDAVLAAETDEEAERLAEKWTDIPAIRGYRRRYAHKLLKVAESTWQPTAEWHREILELNDRLAGFREVYWFYSTVPGVGKTQCIKYLRKASKEKDWLITKNLGTARDAATTLVGALDDGWTCKGICIDLPLNCENHVGIYEIIECLKDGTITAQKYEGGVRDLPRIPHVVVTCNWPPMVEKLMPDRWRIRQVFLDGTHKNMSVKGANAHRRSLAKEALLASDNGVESSSDEE